MSGPRLWRVRLRLEAPLGTPLTSGTLFGHLCWAVHARDGEDGLERWLAAQNDEPWLVSDGFPAGMLPRPLLVPERRPPGARPADADAAKKRARLPFVTAEGFLAARDALSPAALTPHLAEGPPTSAVRLAHNAIDRRRGTTPDEGGLYFVDEDWSFAAKAGPERDVYVRTNAPRVEIRDLFARVGRYGYGRDATWGRGAFAVADGDVVAVPELDDHPGARRLSLSHGTITANMHDVRYRLVTHYGKVADRMAMRGGVRVWKKPLLLARPGATFRAGDDGPFGDLLDGVHQDRPEIRHDARHVALPFTEAEDEA